MCAGLQLKSAIQRSMQNVQSECPLAYRIPSMPKAVLHFSRLLWANWFESAHETLLRWMEKALLPTRHIKKAFYCPNPPHPTPCNLHALYPTLNHTAFSRRNHELSQGNISLWITDLPKIGNVVGNDALVHINHTSSKKCFFYVRCQKNMTCSPADPQDQLRTHWRDGLAPTSLPWIRNHPYHHQWATTVSTRIPLTLCINAPSSHSN